MRESKVGGHLWDWIKSKMNDCPSFAQVGVGYLTNNNNNERFCALCSG